MARNEVPKSVRASLYIDGKPAEASIKNVEQVSRKLRKELNGLTIGTAEWNAKMKQVQANTRYMNELKKEIQGTAGAMGFLKSEIGKFGTLAAGYLGFQFVTSQFHNIIQQNAELSDSLADVRKTTGLTEAQVRSLNSELKKISTRSTRAELLGLAREAGKLGINGSKDILQFVRAADQIAVALGEDLGGAQGAINAIGKLTDIFKMRDTYGIEKSMLMVGSLLNELGASGPASEKFLVDFTQRMAGIAPVANMSIESVMAIAAVMDELGQQAESSSTAIGQFVVKLGTDVPKYAKIAGMSVEDFSDLLKRDGTEALMAVLRNVDSTGGGLEALAENMGLVEVAGARGIAALGVLASNTEKYYEKLGIGNKATKEAISVTNEFSVKNQNLAATLDKIGKWFQAQASSETIKSFLNTLAVEFTKLIGIADTSFETLTRQFRVQRQAVNELESDIIPLVERYEALKSQTNLNKQEQLELYKAISALTEHYPIAISQVDQYGNVIELNTQKIRENIEEQRKYLSIVNKKAIEEGRYERFLLEIERDKLKTALETGKIEEYGGFFPTTRTKTLDNDELKESQSRLKEIEDQIFVINKDLRDMGDEIPTAPGADPATRAMRVFELEFDALKEKYNEIKALGKAYKDLLPEQQAIIMEYEKATGQWVEPTSPNKPKGGAGSDKKSIDKIKKDQEDLKAFLEKNNEDIYLNTLDKESREWAVIWNKYDNLRKQAHGNADLLKQLDEQEKAEEQALLEKHNAECLKLEKDYADKVKEIQASIYEAGLSDQELELYQVRAHYGKLIELAEQYGLDATALKEKLAKAEDEINNRQKKKEEADQKAKTDQWKSIAVDAASEVASTIVSISASRNQAEYDQRIQNLEKQRDQELANEDLTNAQRLAINNKYDAKIKAEKRKAFLAERSAAISQAIINGLVGAGKLWIEPGWPAALPLTALLAAQTAAAVAEISSRKPPAYAGGGMTDEDPAGYVSQATIYRRSASGRPFMAGEAGREWIGPSWMVQDPRLANVFSTLEAIRAEKRMYAGGGSTAPAPKTDTGGTAYDFIRLEREMALVRKDLSRIADQKVVFVYSDFERFRKNIEFAQKSQSG